jgi:hypothetical protein
MLEKINEINNKPLIKKVDSIVAPLTLILTPSFNVIEGEIEKIGSLEKTSSFQTTSVSGTKGKLEDGGEFRAVSVGRSNTTESVSKSISTLKIGDTLLSDISVASTSMFDIIEVGHQVSCIFTGNNDVLIFIKNRTENTEIGENDMPMPTNLAAICGGSLIVALWLIWGGLSAIPSLDFSTFFWSTLIGMAGLAVFKAAANALIAGIKNWETAWAHVHS